MRNLGTVVRGIRTPIIRYGDNLEEVILDSIKRALKNEKIKLKDRDVIGVTESVVGITQGNFITVDQLTDEFNKKFKGKKVGVVFPILSRNRFSLILKALANTQKKIHVLFSYPSDEVGNQWIDPDLVDEKGVDPFKGSFEEEEFRKIFGKKLIHKFTGMDYANVYKDLGDGNVVVHFSNDPKRILKYTKDVLVSDIHTRFRTKKMIKEAGGNKVFRLDEICNKESKEQGYNLEYGLLGSNKVADDRLKLFPRDCDIFVNRLRRKIKKIYKKDVEVMVYGDGAFKDPVCKIWELADPVVSPGFTKGLDGTPNEIKLKYVSENWDKKGDLTKYVKGVIQEKHTKTFEKNKSLGTTPRQLTDLLGSLCDLTSGSGDKGTPLVLVQGYFDDYTVG